MSENVRVWVGDLHRVIGTFRDNSRHTKPIVARIVVGKETKVYVQQGIDEAGGISWVEVCANEICPLSLMQKIVELARGKS
jgi:hypothetical protein